MKLSAGLASLFLLAAPAVAATQTQTVPYTSTYTGTAVCTPTTGKCTPPTPTCTETTYNCQLNEKSAGIMLGPLSSGSAQGGGGGVAPVVTSFSCNALYPIVNGSNVTLVGGGTCAYTATCSGVACTGIDAITSWAITAQSCASCYAIVSATGVLQGGVNAANATQGAANTVTVTATNSTGTSPGVTQTINVGFVPQWEAVSVCCGGLFNSIQISPSDGTVVAADNTYGAYLYRTTGTCSGSGSGGWGTDRAAPCWEQLITATSISPTLSIVNALNVGVIEAVSCNSNTNDGYLWFNGSLLVTTNLKAAAISRRWATTPLTTSINGNQGVGTGTGRAIACDPNDPNIVYVGTPTALKKSTNGLSGASATFSTVSGVGTTGAIPSLITYDPNTTTTGGVSQHFWVFTEGTGFYETYNGGTSFTLTSGGPTAAGHPGGSIYGAHAVSDQYSQLWFVNGSTTVYKYTPTGTAGLGVWTTGTAAGNGVYNIAVDPTSSSQGSNRIIATYLDGNTQISNNNGTTFNSSTFNLSVSAPAGQPPWMGTAYQGGFLDAQDIIIDGSGNLFVAAGIGIWEATPTIGTNPVNYVANSVGIEQLVTNRVLSSPGIGPVIASWDRAFFGELNPDVFPSTFWTGANAFGNGVQAGWAIDYATSNTSFLTGYVGTTGNYGASSSNGGGNWTIWPSFPSPTNIGGAIAAASPTNWILTPGEPNSLYYTTNAATTWTPLTVTGMSGGWGNTSGFRLPFAADRVAANTYCIVDVARNFFVSTTSTPSFTKVASAAADGTPYNDQLKSVPGQSGHFFYGSGNCGGGCNNTHLWKSTNTCTTWTSVIPAMTNIYSYGFGAAKPGGSGYPVIYAYGSISGVQGIYENDDGATTPTWTLLTSPSTTWPNNGVDFLKDLTGDANVYGRIYAGNLASGSAYFDKTDACPWVNFSNTLPNASLTGTVTLSAQHSGLVPVTSVSFYVDGTLIGTQTTGSGTPTTYSQSWVTGGVATGAHTLKVQAVGNGCTTTGNSFSIPITTH